MIEKINDLESLPGDPEHFEVDRKIREI